MSAASVAKEAQLVLPTSEMQTQKPKVLPFTDRTTGYFGTEVYSSSASTQNLKKTSAARRENSPRSRDVFLPVQEWEGYVTVIEGEQFIASIYRLPHRKGDRVEQMRFDIDDETMGDKQLIKPGAIFRWLIGYQVSKGVRSRQSQIIFRRLPAYTVSDQANAKMMADEIKSFFKAADLDAPQHAAE